VLNNTFFDGTVSKYEILEGLEGGDRLRPDLGAEHHWQFTCAPAGQVLNAEVRGDLRRRDLGIGRQLDRAPHQRHTEFLDAELARDPFLFGQ